MNGTKISLAKLLHSVFTFLLCHSATVFPQVTHGHNKPAHGVSRPREDEKRLIPRRSRGIQKSTRWLVMKEEVEKDPDSQLPTLQQVGGHFVFGQRALRSVVIPTPLEIVLPASYASESLSLFSVQDSLSKERRAYNSLWETAEWRQSGQKERGQTWEPNRPLASHRCPLPVELTPLRLIVFIYKTEKITDERMSTKYLPE